MTQSSNKPEMRIIELDECDDKKAKNRLEMNGTRAVNVLRNAPAAMALTREPLSEALNINPTVNKPAINGGSSRDNTFRSFVDIVRW